MRRFMIGVAALGVLSAPPTAVGQAATEPCDPARIALLRISAPAEVAIGRPARASENEENDPDWFLDRETVRGLFVPAVAEGALAFGYRDLEPTDSYPPAWPIRFAEGDGSAVVGGRIRGVSLRLQRRGTLPAARHDGGEPRPLRPW
jgi:hypothetical protein